MNINFNILDVYQSKLSYEDFRKIADYMEKKFGIRLSEQKYLLVQNRLYKRLIANKISDFETYVKFLFSDRGKEELDRLPNFLTTNKTEFFREYEHFEYLTKFVLEKKNRRKFFIWSAACSSGEEPYSIAFTLEKAGVDYFIFASDISQRVLDIANKGVYSSEVLKDMDKDTLNNFFEVYSQEKHKILYQIKSQIRRKIRFYQVNLYADKYDNIPEDLDFIFLRNVLIYFSREVQHKVLTNVIRHLHPNGYLFLGHTEVIFNLDLPLKKIAPSIYKLNQ